MHAFAELNFNQDLHLESEMWSSIESLVLPSGNIQYYIRGIIEGNIQYYIRYSKV